MLPGGGGNGAGQGIWPAHWLMPDDDSCDPDEGELKDVVTRWSCGGKGLSARSNRWVV